jgi:two-component system, NarL family, nitrate/nitrite response regulator NarL
VTAPIRLLLVDDHEVFREALTQTLSDKGRFTIAGHCATVAEAIDVLSAKPVDVVLLDFDLHAERGSALVSWAIENLFKGQILVLTAALNDSDAIWLVQHGVAGIFLKNRPLRELLDAVQAVAGGGKWLDPSFLRLVMSAIATGGPATSSPVFTERERVTLRHIVEGHSNKEIATFLSTSEASVKSTVQRLFEKLGVRSRGHLIRIALQDYRNEL